MFSTCKILHKENFEYAYCTGRIRMFENKFFDQITFNHLIDAENFDAVVRQLESRYGAFNKEFKSSLDFEALISSEFYKLYCQIRELAPDKEIVEIFFYKYIFHNLKVLLKSKYLTEAMEMIYFNVGEIPLLELRDITMNHRIEKHPFLGIWQNVEEKFLKSGENPQVIDIAFDQEYFKWMKNIVKNKNLPILDEIIKIWIDLANIKNLFRCLFLGKDLELLKELIFDGGLFLPELYFNFYVTKNWENFKENFKNTPFESLILKGIELLKENSLTSLEHKLDVFLLEWFSDSKFIVFGVEPLINYILRKEHELRLLRIIVISKMYSITPELIRREVKGLMV